MEIIFVDDSADGTEAEIVRAGADHPHEVTVLHREPAQRWGGLGGAVVDGMWQARGMWVCVMDADLQHPPELIDELLEAACLVRSTSWWRAVTATPERPGTLAVCARSCHAARRRSRESASHDPSAGSPTR